MQQVGVVVDTFDNQAKVQIMRTTACGGECGKCGGCENTPLKVDALNMVGAEKGHKVQLEMSDSTVLCAAFMVYMIPIMMLFFGYGLGSLFFSKTFEAGIMGILFLVLSFLFLKKIDKKILKSERYQPKIVKIL